MSARRLLLLLAIALVAGLSFMLLHRLTGAWEAAA